MFGLRFNEHVPFSETADLVCEDCGLVNKMLLSEELTYREEQESTSRIVNYAYKRENHFNEWLSQFQGIETTTIPMKSSSRSEKSSKR